MRANYHQRPKKSHIRPQQLHNLRGTASCARAAVYYYARRSLFAITSDKKGAGENCLRNHSRPPPLWFYFSLSSPELTHARLHHVRHTRYARSSPPPPVFYQLRRG